MQAIKISRSASRVTLVGVFALVIVLAIVLWPRPTPGESVTAQPAVKIDSVPWLPPGNATCDVVYPDLKDSFDAGARGTPMTTCRFVEEVRRTYASTTPAGDSQTSQLIVVSPATRKPYNIACFRTGDYVTCTGGQGAVIYLYNNKR
jgi:hypothetical protein